ncbi:LAME_0H11342g1_1 [Lachancea meyersii CBS 8951]|uniref:LAME_0H11342g1_1 n=1 Tax=Lachancea meyersii CBS 8951 TaxID=1266667 RepID=A0A1G4KG83_9SACH|nr:LAME_0H11342g1_1 [Lachancea meyersii CBS 8951]
MSDLGNRLSRSSGARFLKTGALGFVLGISLASLLAIRIVDRARKDMDWSDSVSDLSKSVKNLELHVKELERKTYNTKP